MDTFSLNVREAWALATTLMLPLEAESALAGWLRAFPQPEPSRDFSIALDRLQARGYLNTNHPGDAVPGFLEGLAALLINPATLTVVMRRNGRLTFAHYAQLKNEVVQFMPEAERLTFHAPSRAFELPSILVPDWFQVSESQGFSLNLPLEAFALLVAACQLQALQEALAETPSETTFPRSELVSAFTEAQAWLEIYQSLGILGISPPGNAKITENIQLLVDLGVFRQYGEDALSIGEKAYPFYQTWSDPDLCSLSLSLQLSGGTFPFTGSLMHGNGRLILVELNASGVMQARQLSHRRAAVDWVESLVAKGSEVEPTLSPPPDSLLDSSSEGMATFVQTEPWKLVVTEGPGTGLEFLLIEVLNVGRNPENDVRLMYPKVSRQHARFELRSGSIWVQDLNSSNGTFVNGARIDRPTRLNNGDLIAIGDSSLRLVGPSSTAFEGATMIQRPPSPPPRSSAPSPAFCVRCGAQLKPGVKFCGNCGAQIG